jgi:hypothetical protein
MTQNRKFLAIAVLLAACALTAAIAFAEDMPARVRGTLQKVDGSNLIIETRGGESTVPLKAGAPVIAVTKGAMSDIKSDSFVGITARGCDPSQSPARS